MRKEEAGNDEDNEQGRESKGIGVARLQVRPEFSWNYG